MVDDDALAKIRNTGVEPHLIEILKMRPPGAVLAWLVERGVTVFIRRT